MSQCERIVPTEIKDLFEKIAEWHPGIGHAPESDPAVVRFYGYNQDEAISGEAATLSYPRMGLSLKTHTGLYGNYQDANGATNDSLAIEVAFLDKIDNGDYANEYAVYDAMKKVMDDTVTWMQDSIHTSKQYDFPALQRLNLSNISYLRVGPVHTNAYGWKIIIPVQGTLLNDGDNPLNDMTP